MIEPAATPSALIVSPVLDELVHLVSLLTGSGFRVTAAENFVQAKALLSTQPPSILITSLQLGDYNGLHLVLRGRSARPDMVALITSTTADAGLHADAEAMGATFMLMPVSGPEFIAAVLRTLSRSDPSEPPVRPPFERRSRERRGTVVPFNAERRGGDRRRGPFWLAS
jgi:DNA-binding response OmpR family regulator